MKRTAFAWAVVFFATAAVGGAEAGFAVKPGVSQSAGKYVITFALTKPVDVEVAILDAEGRVVRHLAAGMAGIGQSPPPLRDGLTQSLEWDGTDDAGNPAANGPFRARVRLGMKAQFDSFLLFDPDATPAVRSLALGPSGELYAFYHDPTANGNQGGVKVKVLDRQGRHVRQILPFPADLPYDRIKATGAFQDEQGDLVPHCHNWHTLSFYPDTILARGRSMSDFSQPVVDGRGRLHWIIDGGRLCSLEADGSLAYATFLSEPLFPGLKDSERGRPALALSSDGKYLYAAGIHAGRYDANRPVPCVWRIDLATRTAEVFLGRVDQAGNSGDLFTVPRGVAVAGGLLYVADPGADRIAVFRESDRSLAGELKLKLPHIVQVHPRTGELYVCAYVPEAEPSKDGKCRIKDARLLKYADYRAEKPTYEVDLPRTGLSPNDGTHRIALDAGADPPLVWVPGIPYARSGSRLSCYRDTGRGFERVELYEPTKPWGEGARDLLLDRRRGELYVKVQGERWYQIDEKTGAIRRVVMFPRNEGGPYMASSGSQLGVDSDGNYVTHCWGQNAGLMRWSRLLRSLPWEGSATHRTDWGGMMTFQLNYMAIHRNEIYVIKPTSGPHHLDVFDMAMHFKRRAVWNVRRGSCPRVDAWGNIYITVPLRPTDRDFPPFFDGKLGKVPDYYRNIGEGHYWYVYMYGSLVKFPPQGGAFYWTETDKQRNDVAGLPESIAQQPRRAFQYFHEGRYPHKPCEVQGASWVRFGYSPYSETYNIGTPACMCEGTGFDIDAYGRVFYPNACQFRVEMADAAGNFLTSFGKYGNQDSGGPGAPVGKIEIPLGWPTYVAVSDDFAYVNDTIGMRVAKVKLAWHAEATAAIGQ